MLFVQPKIEHNILISLFDYIQQELESERVQLIEEVTANKKKMQELEANLLFRLTSTQV